MTQTYTVHLDNDVLAQRIYGPTDTYINLLQEELTADFVARGHDVILSGTGKAIEEGKKALHLLQELAKVRELTVTDVHYAIHSAKEKATKGKAETKAENFADLKKVLLTTAHGEHIRARTLGQRAYVENIFNKTITFGIGPAGTGKTFLAVVLAVRALKRKEVERIILTRPAVEAGEKLGFLPGDLQEKVDPYLRPLYDGLSQTLGKDVAERYIERGIIEIAPLAYMRGRTLDDAFIILDEAQNTTSEQMKMFLTRIGFGSKAVVTGDITQIDLPNKRASGLLEVRHILENIPEIAFMELQAEDVVRHPVVAKIIRAYDRAEAAKEAKKYGATFEGKAQA